MRDRGFRRIYIGLLICLLCFFDGAGFMASTAAIEAKAAEATAGRPEAMEAVKAAGEQRAKEGQAAMQTPEATEEPKATEEAGVTQEPERSEEPKAEEEPKATDAPEAMETPEATDKSETGKEPEPTDESEPTQKPETTREPAPTDAPDPTQSPETTQEPETTDAPDSAQKPETTQQPEATKEPEPTFTPDSTPKPEPTEPPQATKEPQESPPPMEPEEITHKPKIILTSCDINGKQINAGAEETLNAAFQNCSADTYIYNLKISVSAEPSGIQLENYSFYYGEIAPGELVPLCTVVKTLSQMEGTGAYIHFDLEYEDEKGNAVSAREMAAFSVLQEETVLRQPKILLESNTLSHRELTAGTKEQLEAVFKNHSRFQAIYNLKTTVSAESPSIRFSGTTGTSFYTAQVPPEGLVSLAGELDITAEAERGTTPLYFDFEYEDEKGAVITARETVMLTIEQPLEMELDTGMIPGVLYAADTLELPLKALNLSRTSVYNVRILLSAPGLFPVNQVFIGNMEAGTEGTGTMNIYIGSWTMETAGTDTSKGNHTSADNQEKYGKTSGTITLQYQDAEGQEYTLQKEFQTEIKKPRLTPSETKEPEEANPWWISAFAVMIAALAALSMLLLSRLHRKNILLEEARKTASFSKNCCKSEGKIVK